MSYCVQCGAPVPEGQRTCSMYYGDTDHGRDGYYREWMGQQVQLWDEEPAAQLAEQQRIDQERTKPVDGKAPEF